MSQFTLTSVDPEPRIWKGDHGDFAIYTVQFDGEDGKGTAEIKTKASSPAPSPGQTVDAELVQKAGRTPELKRVWKPGSGGGFKGKSPEERSQIARMNSHGHALTYWKLKHESDPSFSFANWTEYLRLVEAFHKDILEAGK